MKKEKTQKEVCGESRTAGQLSDVSSKEIFGNHELCAQFLRDYVDIPLLKNVRPEDIEDVSSRYHFFDDTELNADTVKKIRIRGMKEDVPLFIISLIEHKSYVDYDVAMQLLRYMVCIWYDWEKKMKGIAAHKSKGFLYPPILPIVYYEGKDKWTAGGKLSDRILMSGLFGEYLPDFSYLLIRNGNYSNEELLSREDEISLIMLLNKIQKHDDFKQFLGVSSEKLNSILEHSSEEVLNIVVNLVENMCRRLNLPAEETAQYTGRVKERNMGYFFENMEPMDIQEERRKTAEERKKAEAFRKEAEEYQKEAEEYQKEAEEYQKEAEEYQKEAEEYQKEAEEYQKEAKEYQKEAETYRQLLIDLWREQGDSEETIAQRLKTVSK